MRLSMRLRAWLRQYPHLKTWLMPFYERLLHLRWEARNLVAPLRPFVFDASPHQIKMYPKGAVSENVYNGYFESNEREFVSAFLLPGMTVVDAGANVGVYTLIASVLVGTTGKVHAFEPGKSAFERLQRNLAINRCQNVVANRVALGNTHEQMFLRIDPIHPTIDGHRFVRTMQEVIHPTSSDEIIECQTLDDYFSLLGPIDFLKIDVEGAELSVLQGAEEILTRSTEITILLECTQNREQVRDLLLRHGFQSFVWDGVKRELRPATFDEVVVYSNIILRRQLWVKQ